MKCTICNASDVFSMKDIKSPYKDKHYTLYSCKECKSRFFVTSNEEVSSEFYNNIAPTDLSSEFRKSVYWQKQKKILLKEYKKNKIKSILDIGCRNGDFLMHFSDDVEKVGVEIASFPASIAKKRGLTIYTDYVQNIAFDKKFDIVALFAIIEHLQDVNSLLNKLKDIVSDDGLVVILIPSFESFRAKFWSYFKLNWRMYCPPNHLSFFSKKKLDDIMKKNGFILTKRYFSFGGMVPLWLNFFPLNQIFKIFDFYLSYFSPMGNISVGDHMYSIYKKSNI